MTTAYLYMWTHIPSQKWYVGSRAQKNCHPNDGYICSSKIVKPMILENGSEWERKILVVGEPRYIRNLESKYLALVDAKNDDMSFNMHNGNGDFTNAGMKMGPAFSLKLSKSKTGLKQVGFFNKHHSNDTKAKIAKSKFGLNIGTKWFNNGLTVKRFTSGAEPADWVLGKKL